MDDRETELSRFRQQWKAEVTARQTRPVAAQPSSAGPSSSSSSSSPGAKPRAPPRKLSHLPVATGEIPEGDEAAAPAASLPEPGAWERPTSLTAVRRPSVSVPSMPGSALEYYERAVEKERQGSLGDSLSLYRKAFRMDAKVDTQYQEKYFPRPPAGSSSSSSSTPKDKSPSNPLVPSTAPNSAHHSSEAVPPPASTKEVSVLIASFAHLAILPALPPQLEDAGVEAEQAVFSPLTTLPSELLLHILRVLAVTDVASFSRCAQVCKALAFLVATEQSIWRDVCSATFRRMLWDWGCQVNGGELINRTLLDGDGDGDSDSPSPERVVPADDAVVHKYGGNWRTMFTGRPRIRFNGIYISTCNYVRSGASHAGWNTPVHIVTYYRYLRFYPAGTVVSLLTTAEPADVVHALGCATPAPPAPPWAKYVSAGRWRLDPDGRVDMETEPPAGSMDRYLFRMQMRVRGVRAGGRMGASNKLVWEGFWSWNRLTDDLAEFSLRNDKAFFFSRVGSIERETGIL